MTGAKGRVHLVGAGPGDPQLITLRGMRALEHADVVVYDYLASADLLEHAPADAERIYVGKKAGAHTLQQDEINELLVRRAREGKTIVRLKGGDPYVFGRGSEEAAFLRQNGIDFDVIPGIPAAVGASAVAGIPLTDRGCNAMVTFVTGHEKPGKESSGIDWDLLARGTGVVVFYMAVSNLSVLMQTLREHGMPADTPAAMVEWATTPRQRTLTATVATIAGQARDKKLSPPALVIVGHTVGLREQLAWFEKRPLFGRTVAVTRSRAQASEVVATLRELGARVLETPLLRMEPPADWAAVDEAIEQLGAYRWVVFTSPNGVGFFFGRLRHMGLDSRVFAGVNIAVIGPGTARRLRQEGLEPDLQAAVHSSAALGDELVSSGELSGARVLLPRADIAPDVLPDRLRALQVRVDDVTVYRTVMDQTGIEALRNSCDNGELDAVTFTSSSTVTCFVEALGRDRLERLRGRFAAVSIGPETSKALRAAGIEPAREAAEYTMDGVVDALVEHFGAQTRSKR